MQGPTPAGSHVGRKTNVFRECDPGGVVLIMPALSINITPLQVDVIQSIQINIHPYVQSEIWSKTLCIHL